VLHQLHLKRATEEHSIDRHKAPAYYTITRAACSSHARDAVLVLTSRSWDILTPILHLILDKMPNVLMSSGSYASCLGLKIFSASVDHILCKLAEQMLNRRGISITLSYTTPPWCSQLQLQHQRLSYNASAYCYWTLLLSTSTPEANVHGYTLGWTRT